MPILNLEPDTRISLLMRLRDAGDQQAWSEFSAVYEPVIYRMVRRRGIQDADAREIVQEVLLSVMDSIHRFDASQGGSFRGWLGRIARNATIDRIRRIAARNESLGVGEYFASIRDGEENPISLDEEFESDRRQQLFRWAAGEVRRRMSETNWLAFYRSTIGEQTIEQVARDLGIGTGAVHVARCRVLKRIRELVHQRSEE